MFRIAKLERVKEDESAQVHHRVLRIPWDAFDSPPEPSEVHAGIVRTVVLPEKAPSSKAWTEKVREHWPPREASCRD